MLINPNPIYTIQILSVKWPTNNLGIDTALTSVLLA